jgi:SIR2-like domain
MVMDTTHNPDRFMGDFRLILSQGRKRLGLLVGAGAPVSIKVDQHGHLKPDGRSIMPDVAGLTAIVVESLAGDDKLVIEKLLPELGEGANIEAILSRVRLLGRALGSAKVHGFDGPAYERLGRAMCEKIGKIVSPELPSAPTPYSELVTWISGTSREHPVEIFTTNYDLLFEEAFERARVPFFDGFAGGHAPFFDPSSVSSDDLPPRWARLWKLHGSLGWAISGDSIIRRGGRGATELIYPDHLKYDQIRKLPYSAIFERLRQFLLTPDTLLIACGFSFADAHVCAVLDEALAANANTAVLAFQFRNLGQEAAACAIGQNRPNFSVYASDSAMIRGVKGQWQLGDPPNKEWEQIRGTFWGLRSKEGPPVFTLGDFAQFARFFALSEATQLAEQPSTSGGSGTADKAPSASEMTAAPAS